MVDLFVFAFAHLSRFPDAKRGACFRVYFECLKDIAQNRTGADIEADVSLKMCRKESFYMLKNV